MYKFFSLSFLFITAAAVSAGCQSNPSVPHTPPAETQPAETSPTLTAPPPTVEATKVKTSTPTEPASGERAARTSDGMQMVFVPEGEFVMGSEEAEVDFALEQCLAYGSNCARRYFSVEMPLHTVRLDSFWIDMTEVASSQYQQCVLDGDCEPAGCRSDGNDYPVVCVSWDQAAAYCRWAGARLPSEAEWEYAARGTERYRYPWGDEFDGSLLNYCDSSCTLSKRDEDFDDRYERSAPVGSYPRGASWVGALDMAGNVWEVVADWNGNYSADMQVNPTGPDSGARKVARGGSWHASPDHVRTALRTHVSPTDSIDHAGFRCARSSPPE